MNYFQAQFGLFEKNNYLFFFINLKKSIGGQ